MLFYQVLLTTGIENVINLDIPIPPILSLTLSLSFCNDTLTLSPPLLILSYSRTLENYVPDNSIDLSTYIKEIQNITHTKL